MKLNQHPPYRRKYQRASKVFLVGIRKFNNCYTFSLIRNSKSFTYQYPTKFEAMVEYDNLIKKYELNATPFFPLTCIIPDKYNLNRSLAA